MACTLFHFSKALHILTTTTNKMSDATNWLYYDVKESSETPSII